MLRLVIRRLLALIPLLFTVTLIVWALLLLIPGDPALAIIGNDATPEQVAAVREELGLNDPFFIRYFDWLTGIFQGDLGTSLFTSYSVSDAITDRLPVTLSLVSTSFVLAVLIGVPAGIIAAVRKGSVIDRSLTVGTSIGVAIPNFWLGLVLITFLSLRLGWFPSGGYVPLSEDAVAWARHMALPAITLALAASAEIGRQTRAGMVDVLQQDFVRTHRAKGLTETQIVAKYGLKSAMMPVVTVTGLQVARLFGLSIIVEQIFNMHGMGQLAVDSVFKRDIPMIQGVVLVITVVVVLVNLVVDVSYGFLNPKVRDQ